MLISELKKHIQRIRVTSLFALSHYFNHDPDMLRDMLGLLVRKGVVACCMKTKNCGTACERCDPLMTEIYTWVDRGACA